MEARGNTHHWAEKLVWLRHDVQFIAVLFAMSGKNDAAGAPFERRSTSSCRAQFCIFIISVLVLSPGWPGVQSRAYSAHRRFCAFSISTG